MAPEILRRQLEQAIGPARPGLVYAGAEEFVLRHGEWMTPTDCLPGIPQHCYQNAIGRAYRNGWEYVEGYALLPEPTDTIAVSAAPGEPLNTGLDTPIPHAWVRDPANGHVYEVTWPIPGRAYIGVVFSPVRADDATWNGDGSVLHDTRDDPLFRQPWTGETWHETDDPEALERLELSVALSGESFDLSRFLGLFTDDPVSRGT